MEIVKTCIQKIPAFRFIGRIYRNSDRVNGDFGEHWGKAFDEGLFEKINTSAEGKADSLYEDGCANIGLMHDGNGVKFLYAIGKFTPAGTPVPEGLDYFDFEDSTLGVCWLYGSEASGELYCHEPDVAMQLGKEGHALFEDKADRGFWFFERYHPERYNKPDEKGNVILDVGFIIAE